MKNRRNRIEQSR